MIDTTVTTTPTAEFIAQDYGADEREYSKKYASPAQQSLR
jgi:hypothetical protein